jgi:anti-sigma factor RsiW
MIDERHFELIHRDLDGELSRDERAELARVLLAKPEARALRDELGRLFGELARLDDVPPPPDLAASVLSSIPKADPARRSNRFSGGWDGRVALRYAAVLGGILLLGAVLFAPGIRSPGSPDISELVGTIGHPDAASRQSLIDRTRVELPTVTGTVNSYRLGGQLVLELDLQVSQAIEVRAAHAGQTFQVRLEPTSGSKAERVLWLPDEAAAGAPVHVQFYAAGQLLHENTLRSSGSG